MLNWIVATEQEYLDADITLSPYDRRFTLDTPSGEQEVIITHVDVQMDNFENLVRKMPSGNFLSNDSLAWILPTDKGGEDGSTTI